MPDSFHTNALLADPDLTIKRRSAATQAASLYAVIQQMDSEPLDTIIVDLVLDLLHLADSLDPEDCDRPEEAGGRDIIGRALCHYDAEAE